MLLEEQESLAGLFTGLVAEYQKQVPGGDGGDGGMEAAEEHKAMIQASAAAANAKSMAASPSQGALEDDLMWKHYRKRGGQIPPRCPRPPLRLSALLATIDEIFQASITHDMVAEMVMREQVRSEERAKEGMF